MSEESGSLRDEMKAMRQDIKDLLESKKDKKFKIPRKGSVSKAKFKKGYITIAVINKNKNVDFVKKPIIDSTIKLDDGTYHSIENERIFMYKNKPMIIQPSWRIESHDPLEQLIIPEKDETYGQRLILARMNADAIKEKKAIGGIGWIIFGLLIFGIIAYYFFGGS